MTTLADFARRVEQDCREALRGFERLHLGASECGMHELEGSRVALDILEGLEADARLLAIREETKQTKEPA